MEPRQYRKFKSRRSFNTPGHAHELTFCTKGRRPFLLNPEIANSFVRNLICVRESHNLEVLAYVVMPEHCHILIFPTDESYKIATILTDLKSPVSKSAFKLFPDLREQCRNVRQGRPDEYSFWEPGGGYDRNMWTEDAIQNSIAYIHNNPVINGLSLTPEDWPWSSASHPIQ